MSVRLFIGNLPYSATEADLRALFSEVAEPAQVVLPTDRETGRPRGFAFVDFEEPLERCQGKAGSVLPARTRAARRARRGSPARRATSP